METLTASTVKAFLENQRDKDRSFFCPVLKDCVFSRQEIRVFGFRNHVHRGFPLSVSISTRKTVRCIFSALSSSENADKSMGDEEIQQTVDTTQTKSVHVKFQLKRECSFGEHFFIVGDDPMFGLWDPLNAVPLNWSEGHVWEVELDMPYDKAIKYKFILKGATGVILWQPGPDRAFQAWRTSKVISVSEDWEDAELQTIEEEDSLPHMVTESLEDSPAMFVTENSLQPGGYIGMSEEPNSKNDKNMNPTEIELVEKPIAIVAENITEWNEELGVDSNGFSREKMATDENNLLSLEANDFENHVSSINAENLTLLENEKNFDSEITIPVLVPGLSLSAEDEEEEVESMEDLDKNVYSNASLGYNKEEEFGVPEPSFEEESRACVSIPEVENAVLANNKQEFQGEEVVEGDIEDHPQLVQHNNDQTNEERLNDLQWGRRTLQQFLMTLGLL